MECPHCKKDIMLDGCIVTNVINYQKNAIATCPECHKGLVVSPVLAVTISAYTGTQTHSDWGDPICK